MIAWSYDGVEVNADERMEGEMAHHMRKAKERKLSILQTNEQNMPDSDSDDAPLKPKAAPVKAENPSKKLKSEVKPEDNDDKPLITKVKAEKGAKPAIKSEDSDEEPLVKSGKASPKSGKSSPKAAAKKKPAASSKKSKAASAKVKGGVKKDAGKGKKSKVKAKASGKGSSKGKGLFAFSLRNCGI